MATLFKTSRPIISAVLNVALLGLPLIDPVSASTISISISIFKAIFIVDIRPKIPTRFPIKFGQSFAGTIPLPNIFFPKLDIVL